MAFLLLHNYTDFIIIFVSSKLKKFNSTNMDIMFEHLLDMKKLI